MIFLTRHEHFNAAHKLYNPAWTEEKNQEVFGKCANSNWHGHNYALEVSVEGEVDPVSGYVIDLGALRDVVERAIKLSYEKYCSATIMLGKTAEIEHTWEIVDA